MAATASSDTVDRAVRSRIGAVVAAVVWAAGLLPAVWAAGWRGGAPTQATVASGIER